LICFPIPFPKK